MPPQVVAGSPLLSAAWVAGTFLLLAALGIAARVLARRLAPRFEGPAGASFWSDFLDVVATPVALLLGVEGLLLGLASLPYLSGLQDRLASAAGVVAIVLGTATLARVAGAGLDSYGRRAAREARRRTTARRRRSPRPTPVLDQAVMPLLRRALAFVVYASGVLILMQYLGLSITPLVAGLGVGGLAVALALQPTLGNFIAGTQIASDHIAQAGDYVELESGVKGFVVEVGWRSSRIRTMYNNMVIMPNTRLAESVITNYRAPSAEVAVMITGGVSYTSDLDRVQEVVLGATRELIEELPEAAKTYEPWFGFDEVGPCNIRYWVWAYATDRLASFRLTSELIKRVHLRLRQEGIEVNYPVRKLLYPEVDEAWQLPSAPAGRPPGSSRAAPGG